MNKRKNPYELTDDEIRANKDKRCPIYFFKSGYSCAKESDLSEYYKLDTKPEDAIEVFNQTSNTDLVVDYDNLPIEIPKYDYIETYEDEYKSPNKLYEASYATEKGVNFKGSIQNMKLNRLKRITDISDSLNNDDFKFDPPKCFQLNERGHERSIKAQSVKDRIVLHSFNDNIFVPKTLPYLIYDNGASVKNKGISFTRDRFKEHLIWAHRHYNGHFYILFIDFSKFFDNLDHHKILEYFSKFLSLSELQFLEQCLKTFEIDVSYLEEDEINQLEQTIFNSLEYDRQKREYMKEFGKNKINEIYNNTKTLKKSVDIGNHLSQMIGIYYPHEVDNYCKTVLGIHCYNRYMDDIAIMVKSKKELYNIINKVEFICDRIGLHINKKKTRIVNPYKGFVTFLKINYFITNTGKIIEKVHSDTFRRERKRIPKLINLVEEDIISVEDFLNCYKSWRGSYYKFDSKIDIMKMDNYVFDHMTDKIHEYLEYEYKILYYNHIEVLRNKKDKIFP